MKPGAGEDELVCSVCLDYAPPVASHRHHRKRQPSAYQRQITFFTVLFTILAVLIILGLLWLLNRSRITF
jgi:hypothetical protein